MREFHADGTLPEPGWIFVFGSNLAGAHGLGAALVAQQRFGALRGPMNARGLRGISYAIPTKNAALRSLPAFDVAEGIAEFVRMTHARPELRWFVTRVGCGLAGFSDREIAPLFDFAQNCSFANDWRHWLNAE